ncbi:LOW QUALITY PROTEIN: A-kinase anchor protein 17A-like [Peromyscus eremicus]|uniref:LOW QUALITY PROTEIN: A-kinase anchor protein 17A-like n=1 Tax=Peromyscus eremicus TaxID=42410 RepID=UPI0027DE368D|nr:LOW QUALITY PROTEIN: A-kinase anchor protein 17A-like [Peromyscus eremicus]
MSSSATIVHDTSEAVALCPALGLYLKPITKMTISVALPPLRPPGKSISNWEVMERLKAMVQAAHAAPSCALRIAKSTLDFVRFEGEVENRALARACLACLDGKTIKLSGFADALRVRAAEFRLDFPSRHDWDAFFRDADGMDEARPASAPDTIHLEGLPCRWFAPRGAANANTAANAAATGSQNAAGSGETVGGRPVRTVGVGGSAGSDGRVGGGAGGGAGAGSCPGERPSEALLRQAFGAFGEIRRVDIPMLDPYREETAGRGFHTFGLGGHLHFEAYVQYREYAGFARAMAALRGMKLMFKGEDGKAVACNIVTFDSTKHLSDASIRRRQLERQKLQELELQRQEQKRREREAEERRRAEERKQRELEEQERARRREEKLRRREQRQRERASRRSRRRAERAAQEEQRRLRARVRVEERRLLLAQRTLQAIRLVAALLGRAKAARLRQRQEERRRLQEAELRRVEREKERALGLQRRERELRQRLLALLLGRGGGGAGAGGGAGGGHAHPTGHAPNPGPGHAPGDPAAPPTPAAAAAAATDALLRPVLDILHRVTRAGRAPTPTPTPAVTPDGDPADGFEDTGADDGDRDGDREAPPPPPPPRRRLREKERGREGRRSRHGRRRGGDERADPSRSRSRSPRHRGGAWSR